MTPSRTAALIPLACLATLAIGGCRWFGDKTAVAPTGQVAATIYGQEVTQRELQAEMGNASYPDAATRKLAEQHALDNIIGRRVLAKEAVKEGIDKTPDYALQKQRALDTLLAESLLKKVLASVPAPTHEEAQRFILDNPDIFAQRKIFTLDQLAFARPQDPAVLAALAPLNTIAEVKAVLDAHQLPSHEQTANLDAVGANPDLVTALVKLKPHDLLLVPTAQALVANAVVSVRVVPFSGDPAIQYATELLRRQHAQVAVQREEARLFTDAKSHLAINKAYQPVKAAPGAHPPAAAAPSPAPAAGS